MAAHFQTIGNYRLIEQLAEGAFGRVYRAEHMYLTNRIAAIKLLNCFEKSPTGCRGTAGRSDGKTFGIHVGVVPCANPGNHITGPTQG